MNDSQSPASLSSAERASVQTVDHHVASGVSGVPGLIEMLTDRSWVVRRSVVAGLSSLGDAAIPSLVEVLRVRRDDEARIAAAVDALCASSGKVDAAAIDLTRDGNPAVVCDAAQILGRRRVVAAVTALEVLVRGADDNVAVAAIEALGRIGGSAALGSLVAAAESDTFFRVFPAIDVLGRIGDPRAVAPLARLLDHPLYALEAARALGRTAESAAAIPLSQFLLTQGGAQVRIAAVALAELFSRAEERHGTASAVVQALSSLPQRIPVSLRLVGGLRDADLVEQAAICTVLGAFGNEESIATLTSLVDSPAPVGAAASKALNRLGREGQAEFARVLREGDGTSRLAVLPVVHGNSVEEGVLACLEDADPTVRALACAALARIGNAARVGSIFARLADPDPAVVHAAVAAIQSLGGVETERRALELSRSNVDELRRSAMRILAYFGYPSAFEVLSAAMKDADARVRETAIGGLSFVEDSRATSVLMRAARDESARTRSLAMKALGGHRTLEKSVAEVLRGGLWDPDGWVRYYACQSLGKLRVSEAAASIELLLDDPAGQVQVAAVEALALVGGTAAHAALLRAVGSKDEDIRRAALIGLGIAGHPDALPALLSASRATDPMTRLFALSALSVLDTSEVVRALVEGTRDAAEAVRAAAKGLLGARAGAEAARALIEMLDDEDAADWVVSALASALDGRISVIVSALSEADETRARLLVSALGRMATPQAAEALVGAMSMPSAIARRIAASTLGALGTREARAVLERVAREDPDPEVRRLATLVVPG